MADAGLLGRLDHVDVPTLVVWGAADRIVPPEHGRAYADHIPGAQLAVVENAGHLPQLEAPDQLLSLVWDFAHAGEITIAPHTDGPVQHRHAQHDEGF
jgi:pimeloyl-ACP methyl ester carboxylesterase